MRMEILMKTQVAPSNNPSTGQSSSVTTLSNHIYFYTEVDTQTIQTLTQSINQLGNELATQAVIQDRAIDSVSINLHINSYGGSLLAGFAGYEAIQHSKVPVTTIIEGYAASAGTFLSIAGNKRIIRPNAYILIHQLSSVMWGNFEQLSTELTNLDKFMENIKQLYLKHTTISKKKLEKILKKDVWFNADEALEHGLVDEVA